MTIHDWMEQAWLDGLHETLYIRSWPPHQSWMDGFGKLSSFFFFFSFFLLHAQVRGSKLGFNILIIKACMHFKDMFLFTWKWQKQSRDVIFDLSSQWLGIWPIKRNLYPTPHPAMWSCTMPIIWFLYTGRSTRWMHDHRGSRKGDEMIDMVYSHNHRTCMV